MNNPQIIEQTLAGIDAEVLVVPLSPLRNIQDATQSLLCENTTLSTKWKYITYDNATRRTKPWSQATCMENSVKLGRVLFEICE